MLALIFYHVATFVAYAYILLLVCSMIACWYTLIETAFKYYLYGPGLRLDHRR